MTEISVGFTIVIPGSLDPGMHLKWLITWPIVGHFEFDRVDIFKVISHPETTHFVL